MNTADANLTFQKLLAGLGRNLIAAIQISTHASDRCLYKLSTDSETFLGVVSPDTIETNTFIKFTEHFLSLGLSVPRIYATAADGTAYIEDYLGEQTLYDVLKAAQTESTLFPDHVKVLYVEALKSLVRFQIKGIVGLDLSLCIGGSFFGVQDMQKDCIYFQDEFLQRMSISYDTQKLSSEFATFTNYLSQADSNYFLYRDFQARNIMVYNDHLHFIDYQSGKQGPLQWDVASILYQSQALIPQSSREELLDVYLAEVKSLISIDDEDFRHLFYGFAVLRLLQVLGAYGKLGLGQGKDYFLDGIPVAFNNLAIASQNCDATKNLKEFNQVLVKLKGKINEG